jgi:hypothetical protein
MKTNVEMFKRCARQSAELLTEDHVAIMVLPEGGFTLLEKRKIELALNDCEIEWDTCAVISKKVSKQ